MEAPVLALSASTALTGLATVLVVVVLLGAAYALVTDDRDPALVLAWLFVMLLVPFLGVVAYFFLGRDHRHPARRGRQRAPASAIETGLAKVHATHRAFAEATTGSITGLPGQRIETTARREAGSVPLPADSVKLYVEGADKFADLLTDLRSATTYIHLMYLIWEMDELTAEVTDVLLERIAAGVEVHVLYDWLSSLPYRKAELKRLARAGAQVVACYRRPSQLNYRNHMKMVVVDGRVLYSGGMNMGQEYIDGGKRFARWRDTHFRMTGAVVAPYLALFASVWQLNGRREDLFTGYATAADSPAADGAVPVQVVHSSVRTASPAIRDLFVVALLTARRRVWIQSPYFVPDEPLLTAMCVAAASGTDVRLMMTGIPDKKLPFRAAHAYYGRLVEAGVTVLQYRAGFLHAKTVTVDDDLAVIGTCNWDIRSLILHDEVVAVIHDGDVARDCARQFEVDTEECLTVTPEQLAAVSGAARLRNSGSRLLSRLL